MKKIKALCYTDPLMGILAYQSHTPAVEISAMSGVKHYTGYISISDKDYKKLKGFIVKMDKDKKIASKTQFKFVKV